MKGYVSLSVIVNEHTYPINLLEFKGGGGGDWPCGHRANCIIHLRGPILHILGAISGLNKTRIFHLTSV